MNAQAVELETARPPSVIELQPIDLTSSSSPVVVFLHGLGDTPHGIPLEIATSIRLDPELAHVKWILPAAPVLAVTGNMNKRMPAWFDVFTFNLSATAIPAAGEEDEAGFLRSIASIDALLTEIVASGVDPSHIVLAGFSQGAAMTLLTGLTTAKKLAGLVVLSGRLPLRYKFKSMVSPHAPSIPIFWGHGTADPLVTYKLGRTCADYLMTEIGLPATPKKSGVQRLAAGASGAFGFEERVSPEGLDFRTYEDLPHYIRDDELEDVASWLKKILPPK